MRHIIPLFALLLPLALASGCAQQRPLNVVRSEAEAAAWQNNPEKAIADYEEYLTRRPEAADVRAEYAKVLMRGGRPDDAAVQLQIALDVEPLNENYLDLLAQAHFESGDREELLGLLNRAAMERGRVADYLRLGEYNAKLGNADEAVTAYLTAARIDRGRSLKPQMTLARYYASIGDRTRQIRRLRAAYYIAPQDPDVIAAIREAGEVPGPAFALPPEEVR